MFWKKPKINKINKDGKQGISIEILTNEKDPEQLAEEMAEKMATKMTKKISEKITKKFNEKVRKIIPNQPANQVIYTTKNTYSDYDSNKSYFGFYIYAVLLLALILTVGGLSGFLWHESSNKTVNHELIAEINRVKGEDGFFVPSEKQFVGNPEGNRLKGSAGEQKPVNPVGIPLVEKQTEESKYANARFDSCGLISNFWTEKWYSGLRKMLTEDEKDISDITSACFSSNAGLFVFILPGNFCESSVIYHFDVDSKELLKTKSESDYECLGTVEQFGKRVGNILKLKGYGEKDGCEWTDYYDYNYTNNTFELKTRSDDCAT